jgi:hypothetical protein
VTGETDLDKLLVSLAPQLMDGEYVFCTIQDAAYGDFAELSPVASFCEAEGLTLLVAREKADQAGLPYGTLLKGITLNVHSSLDAVGLIATVSGKLADKGISANVIAAYYHDHIFVPVGKADAALTALNELSR